MGQAWCDVLKAGGKRRRAAEGHLGVGHRKAVFCVHQAVPVGQPNGGEKAHGWDSWRLFSIFDYNYYKYFIIQL